MTMSELLQLIPAPIISILAFIVTILFLVTIHEFGHFWVARKFGVKIEKFSIGFGKPLFKWYGKRDNTEYCIAWIPLGGYVKMHGEALTSDASEPSQNDGTISDKNIQSDDTHDYSDIADVSDVQNHTTNSGSFSGLPPFKRFLIAFAGPAVNLIFAVFALWVLFMIGVPAFKPYVGSIEPQSIFAKANIQSGTQITAINGSKVESITDASIYFIDNIGNAKTTVTTIDNNHIKKQHIVDLSGLASGSELAISNSLGLTWEVAEVASKIPAKIKTVAPNSPAEKAGLQANDIVIVADKKPIRYWHEFVQQVQNHPEQTFQLEIIRNNQKQTLTFTPAKHPKNNQIGYAGVSPYFNADTYDKYRGIKRYDALSAIPMAIKENYLQAKLTLKMLGRIITGNASVKNMGGPISIADYSGKSLQLGYVSFLKFLAAISLTLAVMNLLPIPVLDGGHMAICLIEMVRRKPLSEKTANWLMRVGMSLMLTFMLIVISVDLWKYLA